MIDKEKLERLARLIRYYILLSTTEAGSGHPTSSLSAVEITTTLLFGNFFKFDVDNVDNPNNDRLIFSKGHASPLLYALWAAAGKVTEQELMTLRKFGSKLEGHPTMLFPYAEAATGSLGQGLSIGVGMALNAKFLDKLPYKVYVLLGDSEMTEGSVWEALQIAAYYKLDNLIATIDVNRLGQRGQTMYGHNLDAYKSRVSCFGWHSILVDGHSIHDIAHAYEEAIAVKSKPTMIIAKTIKGKGVSLLEDKNGWHGKALNKDQYNDALDELGDIDKTIRGEIAMPDDAMPKAPPVKNPEPVRYSADAVIPTRKGYGNGLVKSYCKFPEIVVLDAEVSNSTYSETFKKFYPERFFEMFIAEQNMVGTALGLSARGKIPFVSTFAAFFTRAHDQIRMCQYSNPNIKFCGSHAGVSIGEDGSSQMGLEDIAMFRAILNSIVLYPSDVISAEKLVEEAAAHKGIVYIRTTRNGTPVIYNEHETFPIGGSKLIKESGDDCVTVVAAGITVHEALGAHQMLQKEGILIKIIDAYSIKPIDSEAIIRAAHKTRAVITVEDHFAEGGLGDAVKSALADISVPVYSLAVSRMPRSGKMDELLHYEEISRDAIVERVKEIL